MKILLSTYEALTTPEAVTLVKVRNPETGETILIGPDEVIPPGFEPVYEADVSATEKKADALQTRQAGALQTRQYRPVRNAGRRKIRLSPSVR